MGYFEKTRIDMYGRRLNDQGFDDDDPLTGVANLFDIGLVFIVGLLLTLFAAYRLQDLFDRNSVMTIMKQHESGDMEIITKQGNQIRASKVTGKTSKGMGNRLGVAYQLEDGSMVYVPDKTKQVIP